MKRESSPLFGAMYVVCKLMFILVTAIILMTLVFFKVALEMRRYDIVFIQRFTPEAYYGINWRDKFEIWKVKEDADGGMTERLIYPF